MSNIMLDAPRVEIEVVRPAAHIPGCQLAPNHLSLDADEHKFGSRGMFESRLSGTSSPSTNW